jgi:hypothetical protein
MSYDLEIRSDAAYSKRTDRRALCSFIRALPHIHTFRGNCCSFEDPQRDLYMEIDLELIDEHGDPVGEKRAGTAAADERSVNCIQLHIPYAYMHGDQRDQEYFDIGYQIAHYLDWQLYDPQRDSYLE